MQLGPCRYCWLPAKPAAVCAERRRSTHIFSPDVRADNPTAPEPSLITCTGANPVSVVCSGISWHSTGVSGRYPAADIRVRRPSPSTLFRHDDAAGAADSAANLRRPRVSDGCGASVEQSATTHQGRLITAVISAADESLSLSSVVQLTQFCTVFVPAYHHVMFLMFFLPCVK